MILILILLFISCILVAEIFLRCSSHHNHLRFGLTDPDPSNAASLESLRKKEAYSGVEFLSEAFFSELKNVNRLYFNVDFNNFSGTFFNFENKRRFTIGNPPNSRETWLVFGGSTIACVEVPDELTVPSILQSLVNKDIPQIKIVNEGQLSLKVNTIMKRELIEKSIMSQDNVTKIIIYFGANDAGWNRFTHPQNIFEHAIYLLARWSFIASYLWHKFQARKAKMYARRHAMKNIENLRKLKSVLSLRGISSNFFLQPNVYTKVMLSGEEYEYVLNSNPIRVAAVAEAYCEYAASADVLVPLLSVFDDVGESVYLDWCHLGVRGNQMVARAIFNSLFDVNDKMFTVKPQLQRMRTLEKEILSLRGLYKNADDSFVYPLY